MNLLKLIPTWAYWLAIAALVAFVGVQQVRIAGYQADIATVKGERDQDRAALAQAALDHKAAIDKLEDDHAAAQQLKENEYAADAKKREAARLAAVAESGRLRGKLAAYANSGVRAGETDAAAYQRAADRLNVVSGLLDESIDLVTEGRSIIEQRDSEVANLLRQIKIDRAACEARVSAGGAVAVQVGDAIDGGTAGAGNGVGVTPEAVLP